MVWALVKYSVVAPRKTARSASLLVARLATQVLSSLLVGVHRPHGGKDRTLVYVGKVGTGFSEPVIRRVLPRLPPPCKHQHD